MNGPRDGRAQQRSLKSMRSSESTKVGVLLASGVSEAVVKLKKEIRSSCCCETDSSLNYQQHVEGMVCHMFRFIPAPCHFKSVA